MRKDRVAETGVVSISIFPPDPCNSLVTERNGTLSEMDPSFQKRSAIVRDLK